MPSFFDASGILLALAYGQGPGQANNVGATYEALGFAGGKSFGLSLAAAGYLCACIVGVIYINVLKRRGALDAKTREDVSGSVSVDTFQSKDEIPIASSVDKLSVQVALVFGTYLLTYLVTLGITMLLEKVAPGLAATVSTLLWGFNFIIGSMVAVLVGFMIKKLRRAKLMNRQYQNNYLLSRISGLAFDLMIVSAIASIEISDLGGLWLPFVLMALAGGIVTFIYPYFMSKRLYKNYFYEGFLSMYGMLTGTISSGVLLLREVDPDMETPASSNLVKGSSFGIVFGAPMLLVISYAGTGDAQALISCGILVVYLAALLGYIALTGKRKKK
jgi:ESS family glutamate:Na+ symporter